MKQIQNVIVTGGAGFIGSHIAKKLVNSGFSVLVVDNLSTGSIQNVPAGCEFIELDLGVPSEIERLRPYKIDALLHLAGQSSGEVSFLDPVYDFNSHVTSTFHLLKLCKEKNTMRFIYASSMGVYGDPKILPVDELHPLHPKSFYGTSKNSAEIYTKLYSKLGLNTTIFRMFNVYGPGQNLHNKRQGMVSIYLAYILENMPIIVKGKKERFRDFIYIDDVVDVWVKSIFEEVTIGKTYNLATGQKTTVEYLIDTLLHEFGKPHYSIEYQASTAGDQFGVVADISALIHDLNWQPRFGLQEGLRKTVEFEQKKSDSP